jgi:RNA polymerase sigma factor (sigma-70 family)
VGLRIITYSNEAELVSALKRGEHRACKILYERYAGRMMAVCVRYVSNRADAEEVMLDGFMRVFEKVHQFQHTGSFEGWIRRVMVTESLTFLRKQRPWRQEIPLDNSPDLPDYTWADENLSVEDLLRLVAQLPDGYRTVFNLYAIEGYNHVEIGELLGISEQTSKSQLSRARGHLKTKLKQAEQEYINEPTTRKTAC